MVAKLVLQTERLVSSSGYVGFTLQFAPTVIIAEPNQITVFIGHLAWDGDLVAMEVVGLLVAFAFGIGVVVYLRQKVRSCRDRYRYRYICRPKQIWFLLRGRLKLLRFSDGLCLSFCPRHCSCTPKFLSYHLFLRIPL